MTQVNGFKGFVGYGIRELNSSETNSYCSNGMSLNSIPLIQSPVNFTSDFLIRTYTSGCYYYDTVSGKWFADGMTLLNDTNIQQTHCSSNHLTYFAGGLMVMPNQINIQYVFANASFAKNYTIYLTLIVFFILYLFFAIWSMIMDRRDLRQIKIIPLKDNNDSDNYFYELTVFTGDHKESGTHSLVSLFFNKKNPYPLFNLLLLKVSFKIDGDLNETGVRSLNGEIQSVIQRSSIDSFIMAVKK
jgi:polycystin 1L2